MLRYVCKNETKSRACFSFQPPELSSHSHVSSPPCDPVTAANVAFCNETQITYNEEQTCTHTYSHPTANLLIDAPNLSKARVSRFTSPHRSRTQTRTALDWRNSLQHSPHTHTSRRHRVTRSHVSNIVFCNETEISYHEEETCNHVVHALCCYMPLFTYTQR